MERSLGLEGARLGLSEDAATVQSDEKCLDLYSSAICDGLRIGCQNGIIYSTCFTKSCDLDMISCLGSVKSEISSQGTVMISNQFSITNAMKIITV